MFYGKHLCRLDPWPQPMQDAMAGMNQQLYAFMNGPSEFTLTGTLKDFDITPKLGSLQVPTLVVCGQYDEAVPQTSKYYASLIPGADFAEIEGAAHIANYDQPQRYLGTLRDWMAKRGL